MKDETKAIIILVFLVLFVIVYIAKNEIEKNTYTLDKEKNYTTQTYDLCNKGDFFKRCDCLAKIANYNQKTNYTPFYYGIDYLFTHGGDAEDYGWFIIDTMELYGYEGFLINLPLEPKGIPAKHYRKLTMIYGTDGYCLIDTNNKPIQSIKIKYLENEYKNATI